MRRAFVVLALALWPGVAAAQSSQFGVRGLGLPGRPLSTRAFSLGGGFGLFDGESGLNPAALARVTALGASFTALQDFGHVENPAGSATLRDTRFPYLSIAGPIRRYPAVIGVSFGAYTSRDFTLATADTIVLRGDLVPVNDTLSARGGLSDLRLAAGYRIGNAWMIGGSFHVITGTTKMRFARAFADMAFEAATQQTELSYAGIGGTLGVIRTFGRGVSLAAIIRSDGHLEQDVDSTRIRPIDLPYTFGLGLSWRPRQSLELASQVLMKTWSAANSDLVAQGGTGSDNTVEISLGAEYTPDVRRPSQRPLRLGLRYGTLPFFLDPGVQPTEFGISAGTGMRFAQQRAGLDLGLEYVQRSAGAFKERAFLLNFGVTVRP